MDSPARLLSGEEEENFSGGKVLNGPGWRWWVS
jgi:hypothetical protein